MSNLLRAEEKTFQGILHTYEVIWIGEIHGIRENYRAYTILLPHLIRNGFKNIAWEMRSDFSEKSEYSEDGRINPFSIDFLKWLNSQTHSQNIERVSLFGTVGTEKNPHREVDYEERMAAQLLAIVGNAKSVVITGNYHMKSLSDKEAEVKSASDYVAEKSSLKILKIEMKYAGGTFYNYGVKELSKKLFSTEKTDLEFGTMTEHDGVLFFYVGEAHAVFRNPTTT